MNLTIFGSRTLTDTRVENIIQDKISELKPDAIITSGETAGVCAIARKKARENSIKLILEFANNEKYSAGKYHHRAIAILKQTDYVLFIHDGVSKGTKNEIALAVKMNKKHEVHTISLTDEEDIKWEDLSLDLEW